MGFHLKALKVRILYLISLRVHLIHVRRYPTKSSLKPKSQSNSPSKMTAEEAKAEAERLLKKQKEKEAKELDNLAVDLINGILDQLERCKVSKD